MSSDFASPIFRCDFEVFGKVQGVYFRKYTNEQANKLGLRGWCRNTDEGTVQGQLEGAEDKIREMQVWLSNTGSPSSTISSARFTTMAPIDDFKFPSFTIRK